MESLDYAVIALMIFGFIYYTLEAVWGTMTTLLISTTQEIDASLLDSPQKREDALKEIQKRSRQASILIAIEILGLAAIIIGIAYCIAKQRYMLAGYCGVLIALEIIVKRYGPFKTETTLRIVSGLRVFIFIVTGLMAGSIL